MSAVEVEAITVERVQLRRISRTLGFASVRLPGVSLNNLKVEEGTNGRLSIKPPSHLDGQGRTWPAYALQPECRASIEAEISVLWARS